MDDMQLLPKFLINSGKHENFIHNAVRKEDTVDDAADVDDVLLPVFGWVVSVCLDNKI